MFTFLGEALAFGPGIHIRESDRFLDLLLVEDPSWAEPAAEPLALSYLHLGSVSPDLDAALDTLTFGHSKQLSYHLLDEAVEMGPLYRLFALGHLSHMASDGSAHTFVPAAMVGSAPIGMIDLADDDNGAGGEFEGLMESLGDIVLGDYMAVVDMAYDFSLENDEAWQRGQEILTWYCEEGNDFLHRNVDCGQMLVELDGLLERANGYIGALDREGAKSFVNFLIDRPLDSLLDLLAETGTTGILEGRLAAGHHFEQELDRLHATAVVETGFWDQYDTDYADLGPRFAVDHYLTRPADNWPSYDWYTFVSGNIQTMMQFLPETYLPFPALVVDKVWYTDPQGNPLISVGASRQDQILTAHVRFFSAVPLDGQVRGVVRRDHPGFDQQGDEVAGQGSVDVDIDPFLYSNQARSELSIPFTVDVTGVLGFYLDLYLGDEDLPWFTTSWDRLWTISDLPLEYDVYRDNFGTYGHWPPSLPVAEPDVQPAVLFVKVRIAPAGGGIDEARVYLDESGASSVAGANGIVVFSNLSAGLEVVRVEADGYDPPEAPTEVTLSSLEQQWVDIALHAIPRVILPGEYWSDGSLLPVDCNRELFGDQVEVFLAQAFDQPQGAPMAEEAELPRWMAGELAFEPALADGASLVVRLIPEYSDGTLGLTGWSDLVTIDSSPPAIGELVAEPAPLVDCIDDPDAVPMVPHHTVQVTLADPHSPVVGLRWRIGASDWAEVGEGLPVEPSEGSQVVEFEIEPEPSLVGESLVVGVTNAAGLETFSDPIALAVWDESALCPPAEADDGPDAGLDDAPDAGPDADGDLTGSDVAPTRPRPEDDGCTQVPVPVEPSPAFLVTFSLLMLAVLRKRR